MHSVAWPETGRPPPPRRPRAGKVVASSSSTETRWGAGPGRHGRPRSPAFFSPWPRCRRAQPSARSRAPGLQLPAPLRSSRATWPTADRAPALPPPAVRRASVPCYFSVRLHAPASPGECRPPGTRPRLQPCSSSRSSGEGPHSSPRPSGKGPLLPLVSGGPCSVCRRCAPWGLRPWDPRRTRPAPLSPPVPSWATPAPP
mmetsp:Transcript_67397/g.200375  ORF Transcript_67397/g.200375 Transcript_67397/m.200375 type:complete len:200 (+) Transcript_67397:1019-1618(+)